MDHDFIVVSKKSLPYPKSSSRSFIVLHFIFRPISWVSFRKKLMPASRFFICIVLMYYLCFFVKDQLTIFMWMYCGSEGKASDCNAGDLGLIPGLGRSLEKEMATHSSILPWRIPWTEEPGGLQSTGSQRAGHDWVTSLSFLSPLAVPLSYVSIFPPVTHCLDYYNFIVSLDVR